MNSISSKARPSPTIPPAVSKQLVATARARSTAKATTKRVPPEAAEAISEALRLFISEAHRRASIEVSCVCVCVWLFWRESKNTTTKIWSDRCDIIYFNRVSTMLAFSFRRRNATTKGNSEAWTKRNTTAILPSMPNTSQGSRETFSWTFREHWRYDKNKQLWNRI